MVRFFFWLFCIHFSLKTGIPAKRVSSRLAGIVWFWWSGWSGYWTKILWGVERLGFRSRSVDLVNLLSHFRVSSRLSVKSPWTSYLGWVSQYMGCSGKWHPTSSSFVNIAFILLSFFEQVNQIQSESWCVFCVSWSRRQPISIRAKY